MANLIRLGGGGETPFVATGGTITTLNGYVYHAFTTSGTFQVTSGSKNVECLIVGGGGGGGGGPFNPEVPVVIA